MAGRIFRQMEMESAKSDGAAICLQIIRRFWSASTKQKSIDSELKADWLQLQRGRGHIFMASATKIRRSQDFHLKY
jgi:hypothetical protein